MRGLGGITGTKNRILGVGGGRKVRFGGTVFFPILHLSRRKGPLCVFDKEASFGKLI